MAKKQPKYHSGDVVPMTCGYKAYDAQGQSRDDETTQLRKGTKFPPTQHEGGYWVMDMSKDKEPER